MLQLITSSGIAVIAVTGIPAHIWSIEVCLELRNALYEQWASLFVHCNGPKQETKH